MATRRIARRVRRLENVPLLRRARRSECAVGRRRVAQTGGRWRVTGEGRRRLGRRLLGRAPDRMRIVSRDADNDVIVVFGVISELIAVMDTVRRSPSATVLLLLCTEALVACAVLSAVSRGASATLFGDAAIALAGCAIATWWWVARPFEGALRASRRTLRSLFVENPESIAVYGLDGRIVRGNRAAADMMRQPPEVLIGAHFTHHLAPEHAAAGAKSFDAAARGETVAIETVFVGAHDERIEVRSTLFPHVVDGRIVGVFGVAKDIGDLKRANAALREQSERMSELYDVSSSRRSWQEQIEDALRLACRRLGGSAAQFLEVGEDARVVASIAAGSTQLSATPLAGVATLRSAIAGETVVFDGASDAEALPLLVAPVRLSGADRGAVVLQRADAAHRFDDGDAGFVRLVASLIASALVSGRQQERLDRLAFFDTLTGLPNRVLVTERLAELLGVAQWRDRPFAVHYVDLDYFKKVNDVYGHATGDRVLCLAARRMQAELQRDDMVARLGGDEFVIVQPLTAGYQAASTLALRILAAIAKPFEVDGIEHQLGVSIGISIAPNNGRDGQTLLQRADEALYRAKREGRNRLEFAFDDVAAVASG